jgi:DNA-binding transcriptional LysR family regulator
LDAGFVHAINNPDRELAQLEVCLLNLMLAAPKGHPLTNLKKVRLRDLRDAAFVWFPRRESPIYFDIALASQDAPSGTTPAYRM